MLESAPESCITARDATGSFWSENLIEIDNRIENTYDYQFRILRPISSTNHDYSHDISLLLPTTNAQKLSNVQSHIPMRCIFTHVLIKVPRNCRYLDRFSVRFLLISLGVNNQRSRILKQF